VKKTKKQIKEKIRMYLKSKYNDSEGGGSKINFTYYLQQKKIKSIKGREEKLDVIRKKFEKDKIAERILRRLKSPTIPLTTQDVWVAWVKEWVKEGDKKKIVSRKIITFDSQGVPIKRLVRT
jgi:hypothetical protein